MIDLKASVMATTKIGKLNNENKKERKRIKLFAGT